MQNTNLSEQIRKLRTSKKLTMSVMAERLGVTTSAVAAYENGSRNPSFPILVKIARIFNVTVDSLLSYGTKDLIDVSDLTPTQRDNIQNIILTYKKFNSIVATLFEFAGAKNIIPSLEEYIDQDFEAFDINVKTRKQNMCLPFEFQIEDLQDEIKQLKDKIKNNDTN